MSTNKEDISPKVNEITELTQLKELADEFCNSVNIIQDSTTTPKNYAEVNIIFEKFLDELNHAADEKNIEEIKKICDVITSKIDQYAMNVLTIILDPNKETEGPDDEMKKAAKNKYDAFLKKNGLVTVVSFPEKKELNIKDAFIASLTTRVTYIFHGSEETHKDENDPVTNNTLKILSPILSDEKQYPRLQRLTLLGCASTFIPPNNQSLFLFIFNR